MKKFFTILLILFFAAFGITWTITASNIKNETKTWIAKVNQRNDVKLSYKKLSSTGFPFTVGVAIEGAEIKLNPNLRDTSQFYDTVSFSSPVRLSTNLFASNYHLSFADYIWKNTVSNSHKKFKKHGKIEVELALDHLDTSALLHGKKLKQAFSTSNLEHFKSFSIHSSKAVWSDLVANKELMKMDASHFSVSVNRYKTMQDTYKLDFALNNITFTKTLQDTWAENKANTALDSILKLPPELTRIEKPMSFRGKFKAHTISLKQIISLAKNEIASTNSLETFEKEIGSKPFELTILSLDIENEFLTTHYHGHFFYPNLNKAPNHAKIIFQQKTIIGNKLQQILEKATAAYLGVSLQDAKQLLPELSSFGTIDHSFELDAKNSKQMIQEYHFATNDYQTHIKLDLSQNKKLMLHVQIMNFDQLFDEALNYATRAYDILDKNEDKIHLKTPKIVLSKDFSAEAKSFLRRISDHPDSHSSNLEITLKGNELKKMPTQVGTLTAQQAQTEWNKISALVQIKPREAIFNAEAETEFTLGARFHLQSNKPHISEETRVGHLADAINYYLVAANRNNTKAMNNFATIYLQGPNSVKNVDKAKKLFQKAAALGDKAAAANLEIIKEQKDIPALIVYSDKNDLLVVCEKYTKDSIKNLLRTSKKLGLTNLSLIPVGQPFAIPENLRGYTKKIAPSFGLDVVN